MITKCWITGALMIALALTACDQSHVRAAEPSCTIPEPEVGRFQLVEKLNGTFALDTKLGILCRTSSLAIAPGTELLAQAPFCRAQEEQRHDH